MSISNFSNLSAKSLFSPFVLIREFGVNPKIVLNPVFDRLVNNQFYYKDKEKSHAFNVTETDKGFVIASNRLTQDGEPYYSAYFPSHGSNVLTTTYSKNLRERNYTNSGKHDTLELRKNVFSIGGDDKLIVDYSHVNFQDESNEKTRYLSLERYIYDKYGVLDIKKYISILEGKLNFDNVSGVKLEELETLINRFMQYMSQDINTILKLGISNGAHETIRHSEFIDGACFSEIIEENGIRKVQSTFAPLYNPVRSTNNLYDMDSWSIISCIDPMREYKNGNYQERFLEILSREERNKKNTYSLLSAEVLERIIDEGTERGQHEITVAEMRRRAEKRLILS